MPQTPEPFSGLLPLALSKRALIVAPPLRKVVTLRGFLVPKGILGSRRLSRPACARHSTRELSWTVPDPSLRSPVLTFSAEANRGNGYAGQPHEGPPILRRASAHCRGTLSALPLGSAAFQVCKAEEVRHCRHYPLLAPLGPLGVYAWSTFEHQSKPSVSASRTEGGYRTAAEYDKDRVTMALPSGAASSRIFPRSKASAYSSTTPIGSG